MLFGDLPRSQLHGMFSLFGHILWTGLLGVGFAFLIPHITSRGYFIKAALYGLAIAFATYVIPTLFQMPILAQTSLATATSNYIGGLIWGLVMGLTLRCWIEVQLGSRAAFFWK